MKTKLKTDNAIHLSLAEDLYSEDVLFKCFYWYGADYSISIDKNYGEYTVAVTAKTEVRINHDTLLLKIKNDLIDFKLRDIVTKETKNIRELLTAKAFAHFQTDENPSSEISDPVGFDPSEF